MSNYTPYSVISGLDRGPAILLLNSLGTTTTMWLPQLPLLEKFFRVVRMDTRGHGQSETPPVPYDFDMLIADAFGVMDSHDISSFTVMGCSLGSMTALGMGLQNPDRIDRVVCTAARADAPPPFRQSWDDRMAIIEKDGIDALWAGSLGNWLTPDFRETSPESVELLREEFHKTTKDGYRGCAMALKDLDFRKDLGQMKVPCVFVSGSEDKGASPATMEEMAAATPNSRYVTIPDAGHIINVNNVANFNIAMSDFLEIKF